MEIREIDVRAEYSGLKTEALIEHHERGNLDPVTRRFIAKLLIERGVPEDTWEAVLAKADREKDGIPEVAQLDARFFAAMFDALFLFAGVGIAVWFKPYLFPPTPIIVLFAIGYALLMDGLGKGQSLGKKMVGIQVVDRDTRRPTGKGRSLLRRLTLLLGVFDLVFLAGKNSQRLGDKLANTIVIDIPDDA